MGAGRIFHFDTSGLEPAVLALAPTQERSILDIEHPAVDRARRLRPGQRARRVASAETAVPQWWGKHPRSERSSLPRALLALMRWKGPMGVSVRMASLKTQVLQRTV